MSTPNEKPTGPHPIAVLISDIHYNLQTNEIADKAVELSLVKAKSLGVPLIVAGDLHDTKASLRAECMLTMINRFKMTTVDVYIIPGNHCRLNEKNKEHALEFLSPYATIVNEPTYFLPIAAWLVPYYSSSDELLKFLTNVPKKSRIIMHQGVMGAYMGEYQVDRSSLPAQAFKDFRVISGHYHRRQDIKCGRPRKDAVGLFSYIGNPYTLSFAEANDPPKGFQVLYSNGLLEFVPTNLRKHIILEMTYDNIQKPENVNPGDLIWLKVTGPYSELEKIKKAQLGEKLFGHSHFKLEKIYTDALKKQLQVDKLSEEEILDLKIDATTESSEYKAFLKKLWREVV